MSIKKSTSNFIANNLIKNTKFDDIIFKDD